MLDVAIIGAGAAGLTAALYAKLYQLETICIGDKIGGKLVTAPFIIDYHYGFSIRREGPGILLGFGRKNEASTFSTHSDWDLVPEVAERAVHRAPVLDDALITRAYAGLYEMTPDQTGIISPVPGVEGLYVIAGFSGHGFMHGPIGGQLMAELIADGQAHTVDIAPLSIERFVQGKTSVEVMTFV